MVRLAIIGTGGIAHLHATAFGRIKGCEVVAACDIDAARAEAFCAKHAIAKAYSDSSLLFKEGAIDAIVNATPDQFHAPISIAAMKAGKHVLCEKPLARNHGEAMKMVRAAEAAGVMNMINFGRRDFPAVQRARELVASGKLGSVVHVDVSYLQSWLVSHFWGDWRTAPNLTWRLSSGHGSQGALGDIGIHIADLISFVAGDIKAVNAQLKTFSEVKGRHQGEFPLDANDTALVQIELENGALGMMHTTRWATGYINTVQLLVCGSKGALRCNLEKSADKLEVSLEGDVHSGVWKEMKCPPTPSIAELFIKSIRSGVNAQPDFKRGAQVQKVVDACFASDVKGKRVSV